MTELELKIRERAGREIGPRFVAGGRRVAMVYPSPYRAGMSSLGFQWITQLLRAEGLSAERCFLPDEPAAYRSARQGIVSYETRNRLSSFPILAVSLSYELEISGLLEMLSLSGIPLLRDERGPQDPVIVLGGPITMANPLAVAPFVDLILLGEAEETAAPAIQAFFDSACRASWLDTAATLPGAFVPERDTVLPIGAKATDALLPAHSAWICPDAELSNMFLLEGERGCHRRCSFCVMRRSVTHGGMRLFDPTRIAGAIPNAAKKVGLVGAAISDHPQLVPILESLVESGRQVSLSSLRADRIKARPKITELLRKSGARTLTVASDGASARLRKQIIKGTSETHLEACADQCSAHHFDVFKVYMILGLPGETDEDIDELIHFTTDLANRARPARLALGVAPFVAKKNTPLDGEKFAGIKVIDRRMKRLQRGLRGTAEVRPVSSRWAWVEHEISQGGPETGLAILDAWKSGGRFAHYRSALSKIDVGTQRPWDTIDA